MKKKKMTENEALLEDFVNLREIQAEDVSILREGIHDLNEDLRAQVERLRELEERLKSVSFCVRDLIGVVDEHRHTFFGGAIRAEAGRELDAITKNLNTEGEISNV